MTTLAATKKNPCLCGCTDPQLLTAERSTCTAYRFVCSNPSCRSAGSWMPSEDEARVSWMKCSESKHFRDRYEGMAASDVISLITKNYGLYTTFEKLVGALQKIHRESLGSPYAYTAHMALIEAGVRSRDADLYETEGDDGHI